MANPQARGRDQTQHDLGTLPPRIAETAPRRVAQKSLNAHANLWAKVVRDNNAGVAHELRNVGALPPRRRGHVQHSLALSAHTAEIMETSMVRKGKKIPWNRIICLSRPQVNLVYHLNGHGSCKWFAQLQTSTYRQPIPKSFR